MSILNIAIGSRSPIKSFAVEAGFRTHIRDGVFALTEIEAASGFRKQPFGFEEIQELAKERAGLAKHLRADYSVGLQSGLVEVNHQWFDVCAVVVYSVLRNELATAYSTLFPVPPWLVRHATMFNSEVGAVIQKIVGGGEKDAQVFFSSGRMNRAVHITEAVGSALSVLLYPKHYLEPERSTHV